MSGGGLVEGIWGEEVKKGSKVGYGHISSDTYEIPKNKEKSNVCICNRPNHKLEKMRIVL